MTQAAALLSHLFPCYCEGYRSFCAFMGLDPRVAFLSAIDRGQGGVQTAWWNGEKEGGWFDTRYGEMMSSWPVAPEEVRQKGKLVTSLSLSTESLEGDEKGKWVKEWTQSLVHLHQHHGKEGPGGRVSIGLIRVGLVAEAVTMAVELCQMADAMAQLGIEMRIICYHSRLPSRLRRHLEEQLDDWLDRNLCDGMVREPAGRSKEQWAADFGFTVDKGRRCWSW